MRRCSPGCCPARSRSTASRSARAGERPGRTRALGAVARATSTRTAPRPVGEGEQVAARVHATLPSGNLAAFDLVKAGVASNEIQRSAGLGFAQANDPAILLPFVAPYFGGLEAILSVVGDEAIRQHAAE